MVICPLCEKKVQSLHKRSHLVPEWMYRDCYDDNHKMINIEVDKKFINKRQKGVYAEIICVDCEHVSQTYDRYGSLVLTSRAPDAFEHKIVIKENFEYYMNNQKEYYSLWKNIDFHKFQRFVFACILRTHLKRRMLGQYLLVEKHFKKMRNIYADKTAHDDWSYPILLSKNTDESTKNLILLPFKNRHEGHYFIEFTGVGFTFRIYVSSHKKPDHVNSMCLKKSGQMYVIHIPFMESGTFKTIVHLWPTLSKGRSLD